MQSPAFRIGPMQNAGLYATFKLIPRTKEVIPCNLRRSTATKLTSRHIHGFDTKRRDTWYEKLLHGALSWRF
jgi:hypothetical protein